MAYLECLVSVLVDQPVQSLSYLLRFLTLSPTSRVYPNSWTGVSTPLFICLAETATLLRLKRASSSRGRQCSGLDSITTQSARELYERVLAYRSPVATLVDDTQDSSTPITHLLAVDTMLRLTILLELTQAFPGIIANDRSLRDARHSGLDLAIAVLTLVSDLPESSGANVMLSFPLLCAGSALQAIEAVPRNITDGYNLNADRFDVLCYQVDALVRRPAVLHGWRNQVLWRLERLYDRVDLAPVKHMIRILEAVWDRADSTDNSRISPPNKIIHWMDVMTEEALETLLG